MNWTGGHLQRHSKPNARTFARTNKQPAFRARRDGYDSQKRSTPGIVSNLSGHGTNHSQTSYTVQRLNKRRCIGSERLHKVQTTGSIRSDNKNTTIPHQSEDVETSAGHASNHPSEAYQSNSRHTKSQLDFEATVPAVTTLNEIRNHLLSKPSWAGLPTSKPLRLPSLSNTAHQGFGRRRKIRRRSLPYAQDVGTTERSHENVRTSKPQYDLIFGSDRIISPYLPAQQDQHGKRSFVDSLAPDSPLRLNQQQGPARNMRQLLSKSQTTSFYETNADDVGRDETQTDSLPSLTDIRHLKSFESIRKGDICENYSTNRFRTRARDEPDSRWSTFQSVYNTASQNASSRPQVSPLPLSTNYTTQILSLSDDFCTRRSLQAQSETGQDKTFLSKHPVEHFHPIGSPEMRVGSHHNIDECSAQDKWLEAVSYYHVPFQFDRTPSHHERHSIGQSLRRDRKMTIQMPIPLRFDRHMRTSTPFQSDEVHFFHEGVLKAQDILSHPSSIPSLETGMRSSNNDDRLGTSFTFQTPDNTHPVSTNHKFPMWQTESARFATGISRGSSTLGSQKAVTSITKIFPGESSIFDQDRLDNFHRLVSSTPLSGFKMLKPKKEQEIDNFEVTFTFDSPHGFTGREKG